MRVATEAQIRRNPFVNQVFGVLKGGNMKDLLKNFLVAIPS